MEPQFKIEEPVRTKLKFNFKTGDFDFEGREDSIPELTYTLDSVFERMESEMKRSRIEYQRENRAIVGLSFCCATLLGATLMLVLTTSVGGK